MNKCFLSLFALLVTMLFVSCSGSVPPMQRDYADAVTNINQVDPYYRAYFRSQNGSNYTLADQRRAYLAAVQTARTPVRASDYRAAARNTGLASRTTRKAANNRRAVASRKATRGKRASSGRTVAKRGAQARRGKATAARRPARRGTRRRG